MCISNTNITWVAIYKYLHRSMICSWVKLPLGNMVNHIPYHDEQWLTINKQYGSPCRHNATCHFHN